MAIPKSEVNALVKHSVERGNFVHAHRWHVEELGDVVHDRDGAEVVVLTLGQVQQRNDGSFLVLRWIFFEQLLCALLVLRRQLERDGRVVVGRGPELRRAARRQPCSKSR